MTFSPTVKPSSHPARPLRFLPSAVHSLTLSAGTGPGSVIHSSQLARLLGTEFWIVQHIGSSQFPLRKCTLEKIPNHKSFSNSSANDLRKSPPKNTSQNRSLSQAGAVRLFLDEAPIEAGLEGGKRDYWRAIYLRTVLLMVSLSRTPRLIWL